MKDRLDEEVEEEITNFDQPFILNYVQYECLYFANQSLC